MFSQSLLELVWKSIWRLFGRHLERFLCIVKPPIDVVGAEGFFGRRLRANLQPHSFRSVLCLMTVQYGDWPIEIMLEADGLCGLRRED